MANRWRALHRRRARKLQPNYEPWCPSGWESVYARDDDDDYFPDYDEWNDGEDDGDCFWCAGDGVVDASEEDPINYSPGEMERCSSCNGSGLRKDMTIW
jgi:hypothetical protein